jgi:lipoprotein signal peptidase
VKKKAIFSIGFLFLGVILAHGWFGQNCLVRNRGVSMGVGEDFGIFWAIMVVGVVGWWWRRESVGKWFLIAGGLGNLLDRLRFGYVCDYWNIFGSGIYNNLNDWIIFLGVLIVFFELWRKK